MNIKVCTINDLPELADMADEFYKEGALPLSFKKGTFIVNWTSLINTNIGIIFLLKNEDKIAGALGAVKYPDINSNELMATETFWFVSKEQRGKGIELLKMFEEWAKIEGIKKVIMVHLSNLMPDKLKKLYERMGFKEIETHYIKEG